MISLRSGRAKILRDCQAYLKPMALSLADLGDYKCQESVLETLCRYPILLNKVVRFLFCSELNISITAELIEFYLLEKTQNKP